MVSRSIRKSAASALRLVVLALMTFVGTPALGAQTTPKVFYACYNKGTGTVYRIKEPNTPQTCTSSQHVQFSWTDGIAGNDHGALTGLTDDDHPQYVLTDGTRALTGNLSLGGFKLTNLAAAAANGEALRFEQGVKSGDAAAGDLGGTFPNPFIAALRGSPLSATAPSAAGQVLAWNGAAWTPTTPAAGITDHGALTGLSDDDHPQYLLVDGTRSLTGNLGMGGFRLTGLAAATTNGDALRFEQGVKLGDAAGGDLGGTFPNAAVMKLRGFGIANTTPTAGQVLTWNGGSSLWEPATPASGGVTDHGALTGLSDDDHPQYLRADGVRATTNGFAVTGTFAAGAIPASGTGTRLMWYPRKAAFRVGHVSGIQWDDANVGTYSAGLGLDVVTSGFAATAMGHGTTATGDRSTAMGSFTTASGVSSTAFGELTTASGGGSTAMGTHANTNGQDGSFVYGDGSSSSDVTATGANQFVVRAAGGTRFYSNSTLTAGVLLSFGAGAWASISDVRRKENFRDLDADTVLARIARMAVQEWNYKAQDSTVRHVGPTAQDFYAAFKLSASDTTITTTDIDGIALLAIKALERRTAELRERMAHVSTLESRVSELERRLSQLLDEVTRRSTPDNR